MRTHDNQAPSFQPQPGATTSHAATPHRPEGTFPSQAIAASPTNPFPRRPHEVWMEEPVASRKPVAQAETRTAPESRTTHTDWLQFRLTAPGQPESDLPPWHSGLTMRAPQRSPSALDLPWREMQSTSAIGQPQDRPEQETDPVATPITTLSESAQPLERQEEAGEAEDAGEEEKELQPKRLGEFSQPLVQRRVDVEAATFGEGEDAGGGDRSQRQFNLYAPGQAPPDLPQYHGIQARWALQRSPIAAEPYWYRGKPLQAKLTVGQPNDAYEQEADRVAEQVMSMALPATPNVQRQMEEEEPEAMQMKPLAETITPLVQRQEMLEEQEPLQANCEDCEQEKPIQRSADGVPQVQPDLESRLNASQGGGSALPDGVRSFMEPRFGADFSQVCVYTGNEAVQMNRDLNAQAFTHKQDVYFGAGKSPGNDALTAHELTHVVQQAGILQRKSVGQKLSSVSDPIIQCYQAGDKGHGGIEQPALVAAGFKPDEAAQVYLGNWLRDFSQLKDKKGALPLINILALGEFGHEISEQELGTYIPSEHMDNPEGGETIEDKTYADEHSPDSVKQENFRQLYKRLSPDQQAEYRKAEAEHSTIVANAAKNRLPPYVERSKMHAKEKLIDAIKNGETPEGRKDLGNALHAVEDYFSHSNFTEAAIWILSKSNPTAMKPLLGRAGKISLGLVGAANLDKSGTPQIVTGTYVPGANTDVSLIEALITEVETGQLRTALVKGSVRKLEITAEMIGQQIAHTVGASLPPVAGAIGGVGGAVSEGGSGALKGGKRGADLGSKIGHFLGGNIGGLAGEGIGGIAGGIVGGVEGAVEGYKRGEAKGEQIGEKVLQLYGKVLGIEITAGVLLLTEAGAKTLIELFPKIPALMAAILALAKSELAKKVAEKVAEGKTKESEAQAKAKGVAGPTHSQIAKDAPDHALFGVSAALASAATKELGSAIRTAWTLNKGHDSAKGVIGGDTVTKLVDKYVCHPDSENWWQPIILSTSSSPAPAPGVSPPAPPVPASP